MRCRQLWLVRGHFLKSEPPGDPEEPPAEAGGKAIGAGGLGAEVGDEGIECAVLKAEAGDIYRCLPRFIPAGRPC